MIRLTDEKDREYDVFAYSEVVEAIKRKIEKYHYKAQKAGTSTAKKSNMASFELYSSILHYISIRYANKQFQSRSGEKDGQGQHLPDRSGKGGSPGGRW